MGLAGVLLALAVSGCGGGSNPSRTATPSPTTASSSAEPPASAGRATDIPSLVRRLSPSVVDMQVQTAQGGAEGSGVVWDDKGDIVTNNHVIDGATQVLVQATKGGRLPAKVVAADPRTDLAVVKVDADLPPAGFADELPEVGSLALALGSPLGLANTATAGIVSGLDRSLPTDQDQESLVGLLQTDAAISPGNSGGALVGPSGTVIGINVAYLPPQATGAVSIGFAIPAPTVRDIVTQLIDKGRVEHPYLGVRLAPGAAGTTPQVVVAAVESGGPADDAGIRPGDVVTRIGDRDIAAIEDVYDALRGRKPGDTVSVVVTRGGERKTLNVKLGERPEPAAGVLPREG
ncbi:S1C family serine protease [Candidatus Solirubrobacter pratensis]|uniref:S1C family serine protease n=1 Tax=Candidatus Solirubrobacter pratensis TaxID=1298857 RepID=UPI0004285569|nr:trypsin-like peptidase domain-containing protein [Candidatus Solirubrobacter pratensis]